MFPPNLFKKAKRFIQLSFQGDQHRQNNSITAIKLANLLPLMPFTPIFDR